LFGSSSRPRVLENLAPTLIQSESPFLLRYVSTRGEAPELSFEDALLAGLARDGGLYVPKTWPKLSHEAIGACAGKPFAEVAAALLEPYLGGCIPRGELITLARDAYARFGHPAVTPLVQIDRATPAGPLSRHSAARAASTPSCSSRRGASRTCSGA
jgi:hypothetical protein